MQIITLDNTIFNARSILLTKGVQFWFLNHVTDDQVKILLKF